MEPMTLGSPVGSPVQSPGSPGSSAYLPNFLLGDTTPAKISLTSPQDTPRHLHIGHAALTSPLSHYGTPDYRTNRQKAVFGGNTPNTSQMVTESHTGGPPTRGLFDTLETSQTASPYVSTTGNQSFSSNQPRYPVNATINTSLFSDSPLNPNANESQGLLQWVTVFGFPRSELNSVLAHISSRVRIVDKHPPPHAQANWIHLKCASEQEAQRALACNGNVVSGSVMIGVIACTDEGVMMGSDKENRPRMNGSGVKCFSNLGRMNQSPEYSTPRTPVRIQNVRPLAVGYNQNLSPQLVRSPENVPQKSTGLVSKAMEYMFGW